ncbi:MAG: hypothetical protein V4484_06715 [Pseudomonadota bacterium]
MTNARFLTLLGAGLAAIFAAFCLWQSPGIISGKLSAGEIAYHLGVADKQLTFPGDSKVRILARMKAWAEADDGKPFYMLNLMRHYQQLRQLPGAPIFNGTPQQANAYYEAMVTGMLVRNGGSLPYGSKIEGPALIPVGTDPALDGWSRVLLVRYPNRRAFLQLLSDPAYAPLEPYKMMALEVLLVPTSGDIVLPDLRALCGAALLMLFLLTGWIRSARTPS